jgi:cytochrome c peroxidase
MEGGDDHVTTSAGVHGLKGGRNAPTVWNAAFHSVQFWDGRAPSLEEQAKGPPVNPIEMGMPNLDAVIDRVRHIPGYKPYFEKAFGAGDVVTMDNAAKAIAAYERTLITPGSAYDRHAKGDKKALTEPQVKGMETFAAAGCMSCHQDPADAAISRMPTLRNLSHTAPYMHTGTVKTLPEAVRVMAATQLDKTLGDAEVADVVAFLETLNGPFPQQTMPRLPPTPGDLLD